MRKRGRLPRSGMWTRRDAMRLGVVAGLQRTLSHEGWTGGMVPRVLGRRSGPAPFDPAVVIDGTDVRALALRAVDAATAAGAQYAAVRLTRSLLQDMASGGETEMFGVGVHARVHGAWGFASSPYWDLDEVTALAREATREATANASGTALASDWAPSPVASGHWATPIKVDPFILPKAERADALRAWAALGARYRGCRGVWGKVSFGREEQAVATTEGSYFTQTLYITNAHFSLTRRAMTKTRGAPESAAETRRLGEGYGIGWEFLTEADLPGELPELYERADPRRVVPVPVKPGEVGRYPVVFDAAAMATLLGETLGVATQLDRVLGWEANAGGTSYLGPDPLALLGRYQAASPLVTVTANRSLPRGIATVKWDDEGVEPEDFPLIKDGVLVDYQTTRRLAPLLAPYYQQVGKPVRSHGCAAAEDATFVTTPHVPNLVLEPGHDDLGFADLVADTKRGLAVLGGRVTTDSQVRTGVGPGLGGEVREIVNGQLGARLTGLEYLFSSPALWKNVVALGGARSAERFPWEHSKGQPAQSRRCTLHAVPAMVKDMDCIDPARKA